MKEKILRHKRLGFVVGFIALVCGIGGTVCAVRRRLDDEELERECDDDFGDECNGKCDHCKENCGNPLFTTYYPTGNKFGKGGN